MSYEYPKYVVMKDIPLIPNPLKKGDVITPALGGYEHLNVKDEKFFKPYQEPLYKMDEQLIIKNGSTIYKVTQVFNTGRYTISDGLCNFTITDKTSNVRKVKSFWFINSNGIISPDCEERKGMNKEGLAYKKATGNYFSTKEEAILAKKQLLSK